MKEKDIKDILKSKFQLVEDKYFPEQWKTVLSLFFKKIDYFSHPENVFPNDEKVIDGKQIGTVKLDDGKQLAIFTVEVADREEVFGFVGGLKSCLFLLIKGAGRKKDQIVRIGESYN